MKDLQKEYDAWHQNVHGSESATHVYLCQWHEDALALAPPLQNASVLEVGCGPGDFAVHLSSKARTVTAVDFSTTAIEIAVGNSPAPALRLNSLLRMRSDCHSRMSVLILFSPVNASSTYPIRSAR